MGFVNHVHIPSICLSHQLIDRATSPREEDDPKAEQKSLEESWQDLALIKATQKPPKKQRREDLSEPLLSPAPPPAPGDAYGEGVWVKITLAGCAWELGFIFSSMTGKLTRLCLPSWEAPKLRPLFWQCLSNSASDNSWVSQPAGCSRGCLAFVSC